MVAREGIEPPTRGFSVHAQKETKLLILLRKSHRQRPIFLRDTGT
jgi:hypothetical protein